MSELKYKVGDRVRIKSIDWYNENKDDNREIKFENGIFTTLKSTFLGQIMTIEEITPEKQYILMEDKYKTLWTDEMIEGLVEEEMSLDKAGQITDFEYEGLAYTLPDGYQFVDENGNVINATKIVLEKRKKEYPKTYEECCKLLCCKPIFGFAGLDDEEENLYGKFIALKRCRDAYWKIAGEEMGLGKPWEPDWNNVSDKYCIYFVSGDLWSEECQTRQCPFAFPTEEMRDAFYENFKELIESVKELL